MDPPVAGGNYVTTSRSAKLLRGQCGVKGMLAYHGLVSLRIARGRVVLVVVYLYSCVSSLLNAKSRSALTLFLVGVRQCVYGSVCTAVRVRQCVYGRVLVVVLYLVVLESDQEYLKKQCEYKW